MSISKYAYVNSRVGAMKSRLLSESDLRSLIEVPNYEDCITLLKNTGYKNEIARLKSYPSVDIENVFTKSLVEDYEKLINSVFGDAKILLKEVAKRFEVAAIKTLIYMKVSRFSEKEMRTYPWVLEKMIGQSTLARLHQLETVEELIEILKFTDYYTPLKEALKKYREVGNAYPFIISLDKYLYTKIGRVLTRLGNKDKKITSRLIGTEIDSKNIITAFRLRGVSEEEAWPNFIPYMYNIDRDILRTILNIRHLRQLSTELPEFRYTEVISAALKDYDKTMAMLPYDLEYVPLLTDTTKYTKVESILPFELILRRYIYQISKSAFYGDRFNVGISIAYLYLKENEIRNLIAILRSKEVGLPASKIEGLLVM